MKLDVRAAALAAGSIAVLVYALCTAFCVLVPESTVVYVTTSLLSHRRDRPLPADHVGELHRQSPGVGPGDGRRGWRDGLALQPARPDGGRKVAVCPPRRRCQHRENCMSNDSTTSTPAEQLERSCSGTCSGGQVRGSASWFESRALSCKGARHLLRQTTCPTCGDGSQWTSDPG